MQIRSRYVKVGMLVFNPQYGIGVDMSIALLETKFKTLKTRFSPGEGAEKNQYLVEVIFSHLPVF